MERLSFFVKSGKINVFDEGNKKFKPSFVKKASSLVELSKGLPRTLKNRLTASTDQGEGHYYLISYSNGSKNEKHIVAFLNDNYSKAVVSYRSKTILEKSCEITISDSHSDKVVNIYPNSYSRINEIALTNKSADDYVTIEEMKAALEKQAKEIEEKDKMIAELTRQRDEALAEKSEADRKRAKHYVARIKSRNELAVNEKVMMQNGIAPASKIAEELEDFAMIDVEEAVEVMTEIVKEEVENAVVEEIAEVVKSPYDILSEEIEALEVKRSEAESPEEGMILAGLIRQKRFKLNSTPKYSW